MSRAAVRYNKSVAGWSGQPTTIGRLRISLRPCSRSRMAFFFLLSICEQTIFRAEAFRNPFDHVGPFHPGDRSK